MMLFNILNFLFLFICFHDLIPCLQYQWQNLVYLCIHIFGVILKEVKKSRDKLYITNVETEFIARNVTYFRHWDNGEKFFFSFL